MLKVICAWCKRRLRGPRHARTISHGICPPCLIAEVGYATFYTRSPRDPWDLWVDYGGEG